MAKRLTPEEKVLREAEKKAKREADRKARIEAQRAQWEAERQAARTAFETGLTDHQRAAIAQILKPLRSEQDPYRAEGVMRDVYESEFIESLASQLQHRGHLSANQLNCIVRQYDRFLEQQRIRETLIPIAVGSEFETLIKFDDIQFLDEPNFTDRGSHPVAICRFTGKDGRKFKFKTGADKSLQALQAQKETGEPVILKTRVTWIADNGIHTKLGGPGSSVRRLID